MHNDIIDEILPKVVKPARYTGGELNAQYKNHSDCAITFALAFPDTYEIGMSNLAIQILYNLVNSRDDAVCERVFAPWRDMEEEMRKRQIPLFSIETRTPVAEFDFLGFSLPYEMCYTTVLNMLSLSNIPLRSADRMEGKYPLIIAGGHCTFNPEPMAPFMDIFLIGEAEEALEELFEIWRKSKDLPRIRMLELLGEIEGVYIPMIHYANPQEKPCEKRIRRRYIRDANTLPFPLHPIVPFIEVVHDRIALEVMRGCTRGCRFCQAGMVTRPVREKTMDILLAQAEELVQATGHEDISLLSLSTTDHSQAEDLVHELMNLFGERRISVSLPSQRADVDCVRLLESIQTVRKTGLTFAPEAGTQRMRDVVNKNVTEENLFAAVNAALDAGWRRIKLYFMIGLPFEEDDDVVGIGDLANRIAKLARTKRSSGFSVSVGVSAFVPKPHTPFQWCGQNSLEELSRKMSLLRSAIRDKAIQIRWHNLEQIQVEAALSLGGREISGVIENAWRAGGNLESWDDHFDYGRWLRAFENAGLLLPEYATRSREYTDPLPWDHIDTGLSKQWLRMEAEKARKGEPTGDCHTQECVFCRACERFYTEKTKKEAKSELTE